MISLVHRNTEPQQHFHQRYLTILYVREAWDIHQYSNCLLILNTVTWSPHSPLKSPRCPPTESNQAARYRCSLSRRLKVLPTEGNRGRMLDIHTIHRHWRYWLPLWPLPKTTLSLNRILNRLQHDDVYWAERWRKVLRRQGSRAYKNGRRGVIAPFRIPSAFNALNMRNISFESPQKCKLPLISGPVYHVTIVGFPLVQQLARMFSPLHQSASAPAEAACQSTPCGGYPLALQLQEIALLGHASSFFDERCVETASSRSEASSFPWSHLLPQIILNWTSISSSSLSTASLDILVFIFSLIHHIHFDFLPATTELLTSEFLRCPCS